MALGSTVLGGGTFTGRAIHDSGVFPSNIAEDVSDLISMISPYETPLLNLLGDPDLPARSILHEWLEDSLAPNTIVTSSAANPTVTTITIASGNASHIMVGAILRVVVGGVEEYLQVEGIASNDLTLARAFAGTTAVTIAAGASIDVVNDASVEGADVQEDISKARIRLSNNTQIFKKDVIVSGTMRAVNLLGGIADELDYQVQHRTREALRDLEKAVILSRASNTIGSATATRTMKGLLQQIVTNSVSLSAISNTALTAAVKLAWDQGGSDLDCIVCGQTVKEKIDLLNASRVRTVNTESQYRDRIETYEGTYGIQQVILSRWMPATQGVIIAKNRIKVVPLAGRSFQYEAVAKTGDSEKGMVLGEYTLEVRNQEGMVKFNL